MRRPKQLSLALTIFLAGYTCLAQRSSAQQSTAHKPTLAGNSTNARRNSPERVPATKILYRCADSPTCDSPEDIAFELARQHDLESTDPDVLRAARAYTTGVTVVFGDPGPGMQSASIHNIRGDSTTHNGLRAIEKVIFRPSLPAVQLEAALGHEGSHIGDAQDFVKAITPTGEIDQSRNVSIYRTEFRAYMVTDVILAEAKVVAEFGDCGKQKPCRLGARVDRTHAAENIDRLLADDYSVTPQHPGRALFEVLTPPYLHQSSSAERNLDFRNVKHVP